MYSALAGFVEPGESLEEAVAREVMEEVGEVVEQVGEVVDKVDEIVNMLARLRNRLARLPDRSPPPSRQAS